MHTLDFIKRQLTLECLRVNENGYLEPFQCNQPDQPPRIALYRTAEGEDYLFLNQSLPPLLRQHLKLLPSAMIFNEVDQIRRTLAEDTPCESVLRGRTYHFLAGSDPLPDADIVYGKGGSQCSIIINGVTVSTCSSVREDASAAEAWVYTEEAYRGQGYGRRVVRAWARRITRAGKIAFYSHAVDHCTSQRLVEGLAFHHLYDYVSYI